MFADEIAREKVNKLIEAIKNKDSQKIEKAKYEVLCDCANLFDLVTNYIVLEDLIVIQTSMNLRNGQLHHSSLKTERIKRGKKLFT